MNLLELFPQVIGQFTLDREMTTDELNFMLAQPTKPNLGNVASENNYLLNTPELESLKLLMLSKVQQHFNEVYKPDLSQLEIYITQSWLNFTYPSGFHHIHNHPNSFLSGVYYVHGEGESDKITFYRDSEPPIDIPTAEWNTWNSKSWWLPANTGELLLFPSSLKHGVNVTTSKEPRISLAFNTFFRGSLGSRDLLTELII